jgi:flagellar protein FlaG
MSNMSSKVVLPSAPAEPALGAGSAPAPADVKPVKPISALESAGQADLRLIIEEAGDTGQYVYTVVDRRTGKVLSRMPRDEVLRLREQAGYSAGAVFNGKV